MTRTLSKLQVSLPVSYVMYQYTSIRCTTQYVAYREGCMPMYRWAWLPGCHHWYAEGGLVS
jgi:hypothetical protein